MFRFFTLQLGNFEQSSQQFYLKTTRSYMNATGEQQFNFRCHLRSPLHVLLTVSTMHSHGSPHSSDSYTCVEQEYCTAIDSFMNDSQAIIHCTAVTTLRRSIVLRVIRCRVSQPNHCRTTSYFVFPSLHAIEWH